MYEKPSGFYLTELPGTVVTECSLWKITKIKVLFLQLYEIMLKCHITLSHSKSVGFFLEFILQVRN